MAVESFAITSAAKKYNTAHANAVTVLGRVLRLVSVDEQVKADLADQMGGLDEELGYPLTWADDTYGLIHRTAKEIAEHLGGVPYYKDNVFSVPYE